MARMRPYTGRDRVTDLHVRVYSVPVAKAPLAEQTVIANCRGPGWGLVAAELVRRRHNYSNTFPHWPTRIARTANRTPVGVVLLKPRSWAPRS